MRIYVKNTQWDFLGDVAGVFLYPTNCAPFKSYFDNNKNLNHRNVKNVAIFQSIAVFPNMFISIKPFVIVSKRSKDVALFFNSFNFGCIGSF